MRLTTLAMALGLATALTTSGAFAVDVQKDLTAVKADGGASKATTSADLLAASDSDDGANWLMVHRTYSSHRYSPLKDINSDNVAGLKLAYVTTFDNASRGGKYASARNEGTPLVEDGFMYVQAGWSVVYKVDVRDGKQGKIVWAYDPDVDKDWISNATCCGAENRGIGLWNNDVIALTMDGRIMAINKDTGDEEWEQQVADKDRAESFTGAPLIVNDTAVFGPAGGEYGIRGWVQAFDLKNQKTLWKTYTIPGPGEPGNETWEGDAWKTGGGSIWQTGSYDPDSKTMYWGTGNPAPQIDAEYRPGDNLYASSLLALDSETGKMKWYFQFTPNDPYDYDEIGDNQLLDANIDGQDRKLIVRAARNGFMYGFDRTNGQIQYGKQYVQDLSWTHGIDQKTGKPVDYDPSAKLQKYVKGTVGSRQTGDLGIYCPTLGGGKNWQPAAYNPDTKLLYVTLSEGCSAYQPTAAPNPTTTGGDYNVVTAQKEWNGRLPAPDGTKLPDVFNGGSVAAIDPLTGDVVAKVLVPKRGNGMLTTGGNLAFTSYTNGFITAYDAKTLEKKWEYNVGTALAGPPISFSANGKEYIAVLAGASPSAADKTLAPESAFFVPTDQLYVFALDSKG